MKLVEREMKEVSKFTSHSNAFRVNTRTTRKFEDERDNVIKWDHSFEVGISKVIISCWVIVKVFENKDNRY